MLENVEDYIYIRDTILFAEKEGGEGGESEVVERATIDTDVLGIREQVRLPRAVDQYYLNEVSAWHSDALSDSVEFDWPIPLKEKLPTPPLGSYVDENKLSELSIDIDTDVFHFIGGEDPDLSSLEERYDQAYDDKISADSEALSAYEENCKEHLSALNETLGQLSAEKELINEQFADIYEEREKAILEAEEELDSDISSIMREINEVNKKKASGEITEGEWNSERNRLQESEYDRYSDNRNEITDIELEYLRNYALWQELLRDNQLSVDKANSKYKSDLQTELSSYNDKLEKNNKKYKETVNDIYLESNAAVGDPWYENLENVQKQLNMLSIYPAEDNVSCAIPWVPSKQVTSFIEYNDRLYADWEKLVWKKMNARISKQVDGFWETYTAWQRYDSIETQYGDLAGYTINTEFDRWNDGDDVFYERSYSNKFDDAHEDSEYFFDNNNFKLRLGNRHEAGNIKSVKAVVSFEGFGEGIASTRGDHGKMYGIVDCTKVGVQQEDYLTRYDEENDRHLKETHKIEDDYYSSKLSVDHEYKLNVESLELNCQKDIDKLSSDAYEQIREITKSYIQGLDQTMQLANKKAEAGEDNKSERQQIQEQLVNLMSDKAEVYEELDEKVRDRRKALKDVLDVVNRKYYDDIKEISDNLAQKTADEGTAHAEEIRNIYNDFYDEREDWNDAAAQVRDEAIQAARDKLEEFMKGYDEDKKSQNEGFVQEWNNHFEEDYPELKFDDDYNIIDEGFSYSDIPTEKDRQWAFDNIQQPIHNWRVGWYQPQKTATDTRTSEIAQAEADFSMAISEFEDFLPEQRELWTFDAAQFQAFAEDFTSEQEYEFKSAWGEKGVFRCSIIAVYAELDYGVNTGVEYPDYESLDKGEEPEKPEESAEPKEDQT